MSQWFRCKDCKEVCSPKKDSLCEYCRGEELIQKKKYDNKYIRTI